MEAGFPKLVSWVPKTTLKQYGKPAKQTPIGCRWKNRQPFYLPAIQTTQRAKPWYKVPHTWRNYSILQSHKQTRLNYTIKIRPSNTLSHRLMHFGIITPDSRREEPSWGALIAEVTVWEWLMNKAEISCFLSRALKQMSHSGNFPLSINGKAQLAREKWLWVSCREGEEGTKLLESLRYSQRALKVSNGKSNQFIIPLYELLGFYHSVMHISFGHDEDQMELH